MSTIDNRVVQMEFENKNFERNAKESMKTLEKLDKSLELKNGTKSFKDVEEAAKACDFKPLMEAVDGVKVQFTALGAVTNRVMQRITDSVLDTGKKMLKSLTIDPIMSGYTKYEEKTASVQTLLNSTGLSLDEVNGYLSKLMWFSDETSYSFTQMTSALATMTSAGGDIAKIVPMLQGVANATAFAGKSAREFSGAIFNLNQSYSGGFLSYMDYNSLDRTYNMFSKQLKQAFIDNAKALGKLDKEGRTASGTLVEISNFASTLSEKWADRDVMEASFGWFNEVTEQAYALVQAGKYATASDAYEALAGQFNDIQYAAARSAQEAKSFTEAIDSVKDAVSSGWMQTFEYLFGNYEQSKVLWTDLANSLYDIFAEPANQRNSVLKEALTDTWGQFQEQITDTGIEWEKFQDRLIEYGKANGKITEEEIQNAKSLEDVIKSGWLNGDIVSEVLKGFTKGVQTKSMEERIADANKIAREVMRGDWGKGDDRRKRLIEAGYDAAEVQKYVNTLYQKGKLAVEDLGKAEETLSDITDEQRETIEEAAAQIEKFDKLIASFKDPSGRDKMLQGIKNILNELLPILDVFKLAWTDVFGELSADNITSFINKFAEMSEEFKISDETLESLRDTFGGVFAILKFIIRVGKGLLKVFSPFFRLVTRVAGRVVKAFGNIGSAIKKALSGTIVERLGDTFHAVFDKVISVIESFLDFVGRAGEAIKELVPSLNIGGQISNIIQSSFGSTVLESVLSFLEGIKSQLDQISKEDIKDWFDKVGQKISAFRSKIISVWQAIKKFLNPAIQRLKQVLQPVVNYLTQNVIPAVSGFVSEIINSDHPLQTLWEKLKALVDPVTNLWDTLKNLMKKIDFSKWGEEVGGAIKTVQDKIEDFLAIVKNKLQGLDLTKIVAIAAVGAVATVIVTIDKALAGITNLSTSVKTFFDNLVTYIRPAAAKTFSKNVTIVTGAIIALIAAVYLLSTIDDKRSLWSAVGAVATLAIILGVLSGGLTLLASKIKLQTAAKMGNLAKGMLAIAGAIGIVSLSLLVISQIKITSWKQIGMTLTMLAGAVAVLMIAVIAISRFGKSMPLKSVSVIAIALSILLLVKALEKLTALKLEANAGLFDTLQDVLMSMFALALISRSASFSGMLGVAGVIGAVYLLMVVIDKLKTFDFSGMQNNVASVIFVIGSVMALYIIASIAGAAANKYSAKSVISIAVSLLAIVGSIWLLGKVLTNYSKTMDADKVQESLRSFAVIWLMVIGLILTLGLASNISAGNGGFIKIGAGLLLAVGAMALLSLVLESITNLITENPGAEGKIWAAVGIIAVLSLVVDGIMLAAGGAAKLGGKTGMVYMIAALGMIIAIVTAFYALQLIPVDQMLKTAFSIGLVMVAIGGVMLAMALAVKMANNAGKGSKKGIWAMLAMILPLIAVAGSLFVLAQLPWDSLLAAMVALGGVILAMAVAAKIAEGSMKGGFALLAMGASILAIAFALTMLAAIPWQALLKAGIALLATMAVMALIGSLASVTILGAAAIAILSVALLIAAAAFVVFTSALERLQSVDFATIGSGLWEILGPLAILAAIGLLGSIGGFGLIVLSGGMLALAGAIAVLSGSAILAADALLFAKGAWDFLSGKGTESWELAVQMRNEANALKEESNNMQQSIDEATEKTTESIDNYGEETANAYEQAGEKITEAQAEAQISAPPQETVADLQNEVANGGGTTEGGTEDAAAAMGVNFDVSKYTTGFMDQITGWLGGSDAMAALSEGFGNLFSGLDFSSIGNGLNLEGLGAIMAPQINSEENAAAVTEGMQGLFSGSTEAGAAAGTEGGNAYAGAAAAAMVSAENTMSVTTSGQDLGNAAAGGFQSVSPAESGKYFIAGIKTGIGNEASSLFRYIESIANQCINKLNITWSVRSPSRETQWSAMQFVNGLVVGIRDNQKYAIYAIEDLAGDTLDTLNRVLDSDQDGAIRPVLDMSEIVTQMDTFGSDSEWKPVITPVLDMSGVEPGLRNLNAIAGYRAPQVTETNAGIDTGDNADSPVTFNQYNYSPKALSRLEIYRQTKNQLSMMKGVARKKV
mgnify:CR=1 FL=1